MHNIMFLNNWGESPEKLLERYKQQTPNNDGVWNDIKATLNPEAANFFIIMEGFPPTIDDKKIPKEKIIYFQREPDDIIETFGLPNHFAGDALFRGSFKEHYNLGVWFINKPFLEIASLKPPLKSKKLSAVISAKNLTYGHKQRLRLLFEVLKLYPAIEIFGRGFSKQLLGESYKGVLDYNGHCKFRGLIDYAYSLAIDNVSIENMFDEKLIDCFLTWTKPIYWGCKNIDKYFPPNSYVWVDIFDPDVAERIVEEIQKPIDYEALKEARELVLYKYNLWPSIEKIINSFAPSAGKKDNVWVKRKNFSYATNNQIRTQISPHLHRFLSEEEKVLIEEINPLELFTYKRFDLPAKYIYAKLRDLQVDCSFGTALYTNHLYAFNKFKEGDGTGKEGPEMFLTSFNRILDSIKEIGFNARQSAVPVSYGNNVIDGSHRLAACLLFKKPPQVFKFKFEGWHYTYDFFKQRGLKGFYSDAIAYEYCLLKKNTCLALLFPSAVGHEQEVRNILLKYGPIYYEKNIYLRNEGPIFLMMQIYRDENWLGDWSNHFAGARLKAKECFKGSQPLRVFLIETDNPEMLKKAKEEIRAIYQISNHSIHINDTHDETIRVAQLLFNENSVHFLNTVSMKYFPEFLRNFSLWKVAFKNKSIDEKELFCITGSAVMALYGIRDAQDIDYFHFNEPLPLDFNGKLGSHNTEIKHYSTTRDDIIFNPANHFFFDGYKFASLPILKEMKEKRGEAKDRVDIDLLQNWLTPGTADDGSGHNPQKPPEISIILLNYNGLDDIRLCIDSIQRNTLEPYEIIIFDNASTDNSQIVLKSFPKIVLVESPINLGCPGGRAQAMSYIHPHSQYIIFLDNDTIVTKEWTTKFIEHIKRDPGLGMIGPRSNYVSGMQLVEKVAYRTIEELEAFAEQWGYKHKGSLTPSIRLVGFCLFISRKVIDKIGGIDASFGKFGFEDDDYTWRANIAGFKTVIANDIFIHHKGGPQRTGDRAYNQSLLDAWEIFKNKWGIPTNIPYGADFNVSEIISQGYTKEKCFIPIISIPIENETEFNDAFARAQETIQLGKVDEAIDLFEKLIIKYPNSGVLYAAIGTLYSKNGEIEKARDSLQKAIERLPFETEVHIELAEIYLTLQQVDKAEAIFKNILSFNDSNLTAIRALIDILISRGRINESIEILTNTILKYPDNPDFISLFGKLALILGNSVALDTCLQKIKEISPNHPSLKELKESQETLLFQHQKKPTPTTDSNQKPPIITLAFPKLQNFSLNPVFLEEMRNFFHANIFIETGTYYGNTALNASDIFQEIYTIELSEALFEKTKERFQNKKNIFIYHGDSGKLLAELLKTVQGKILFWLDGHYSGEGTAKTTKDTPIMEELKAIAASGKKDSIILIDDIRLFKNPHYSKDEESTGYPTINEVCALIETIDPDYQCIVLGDILLAYNRSESTPQFSTVAQAITVSRFFTDGNLDDDMVIKAENIIRSAQDKELAVIELHYRVFHSDSSSSGYFRLWYALTRMGQGFYTEAIQELLEMIKIDFVPWRLYVYLAEGYLNTDQIDLAQEAIENAIGRAPHSSYAREVLEIIKKKSNNQKPLSPLNSNKDSSLHLFQRDMVEYERLLEKTEKRFPINPDSIWCLDERTSTLSFDPHYILHTAWAARTLAGLNPPKHIDISSSLYFSSIVSAFIPVDFYDYRPAPLQLSGFQSNSADLTNLPFEDESIESLSCMHVVEHIGLGRYGDPIDPDGDLKAIAELKRVIKTEGNLLFVVPIGIPKLIFNAHRIYSYDQIIKYFDGFSVEDFSLIPDTKQGDKYSYLKGSKELSDQQVYGCGCFKFKKQKTVHSKKEKIEALLTSTDRENHTFPIRETESGPFPNSLLDDVAHIKELILEKGKRSIDIESQKKSNQTIISGRVSILIPASNYTTNLRRCLDSIAAQIPYPYDIILSAYDSFSKPNWLKLLNKKNDYLKIVEVPKNPNYAERLNKILEKITGQYVLILDPNSIVLEGAFGRMLESLNENPTYGIAVPMFNQAIGSQQIPGGQHFSFKDYSEYASQFSRRNRHRFAITFEIDHLCVLINRAVFEVVGQFNQKIHPPFFVLNDFRLRALISGYQTIVTADTCMYVNRDEQRRIGFDKIFHDQWDIFDPRTELGRKISPFVAIKNAGDNYSKGLFDQSVQDIIEGIKVTPENEDLYYCLAEILFQEKSFQEVIETLQAMPETGKNKTRTLELHGYSHFHLGHLEESEKYAEKVISLSGVSSEILNLKGLIALKQEDSIGAEKWFSRAIDLNPGVADPYVNLGVMKWHRNEKEEGLELIEKGFILSPKTGDFSATYQSAVTSLNQFSRAETVVREAMGLFPNQKNLSFFLIDILLQQQKNNDAMEEIEKALLTFGINEEILSAANTIREKIGPLTIASNKKGTGTLSVCMIVKNEATCLARCLASLKPVADEIIVVDTGSTDATKAIAAAFGAQVFDYPWTNDFSEARNISLEKAKGEWILVHDADEVISPLDVERFKDLLRKKHSKPIAYELITRNYIMEPAIDGWTANIGEYREEESGSGWFPSNKVRLFRNDPRIRFSNPVHEILEISIKQAGIEIKPCSIPIHHFGKLPTETNEKKRDIYYLLGKRKLELMGDIPIAHREMAIQAEELGKHDEAIKHWQAYARAIPNNALAHFNMASIYLEMGEFANALEMAQKALAIDPQAKETILTYATVSLCTGDPMEAVTKLEGLLTRVQNYPPAQVALAAAYCINGKKGEGVALMKEMRRKGFNYDPAMESLSKKLLLAGRTELALNLLESMLAWDGERQKTLALLEECRAASGRPSS